MTDMPVYKIEIRFGPDLLVEKTYPDNTFLKDLNVEFNIATMFDGVDSVRLWHDKLPNDRDSVLIRTWYSPKTNEEIKPALQDTSDTIGMSMRSDGHMVTSTCLFIGCVQSFNSRNTESATAAWTVHVNEEHLDELG